MQHPTQFVDMAQPVALWRKIPTWAIVAVVATLAVMMTLVLTHEVTGWAGPWGLIEKAHEHLPIGRWMIHFTPARWMIH